MRKKSKKTILLAALFPLAVTPLVAHAKIPLVEPLSEAISSIIPKGIVVSYASGVDQTMPVFLERGNEKWETKLDSAIAGTGLEWKKIGHMVAIQTLPGIGAQPVASQNIGYDVNSPGLSMVPYKADALPGANINPVPAHQAVASLQATGEISGLVIDPIVVAAKDGDGGAETKKPQNSQIVSNQAPHQPSSEVPTTKQEAPIPVANAVAKIAAVSTPAQPLPPPEPPAPKWVMPAGSVVAVDLKNWAAATGWTVYWTLPTSPTVPSALTMTGSFQDVSSQIITALHSEGLDIRAFYYTGMGSQVLIVTQSGVQDGDLVKLITQSQALDQFGTSTKTSSKKH